MPPAAELKHVNFPSRDIFFSLELYIMLVPQGCSPVIVSSDSSSTEITTIAQSLLVVIVNSTRACLTCCEPKELCTWVSALQWEVCSGKFHTESTGAYCQAA